MSIIDDILKAIQGTPAQGGLYFPDTVLPPFYNTMAGWGPTISKLWDTPLPTYQGNIDPGMSPTMQRFMQMMQGNAMAPPNSSLQGAQGVLGRYSMPGAGMMGQNDISSARNALMRYQNPQWMNAGRAAQGQPTNYFGTGGGGAPNIQALLQGMQAGGKQPMPPQGGGFSYGFTPQQAPTQASIGGGGSPYGTPMPGGGTLWSRPGQQPGGGSGFDPRMLMAMLSGRR